MFTVRPLLLVAVSSLTGCLFLLPAPKRPVGVECSRVQVIASHPAGDGGGMGLIVVPVGNSMTEYAKCPAAPKISPQLVNGWKNFFASESSKPIHAESIRYWTEPHNGVLYYYQQYMFYFHGCDYWTAEGGGRCAPAHPDAPTSSPATSQSTAPPEPVAAGNDTLATKAIVRR